MSHNSHGSHNSHDSHDSHEEFGERPVEQRLRRALAARTQLVTVADLNPAAPPGPHLRRSWLGPFSFRQLAVPLGAFAAGAALVIGVVLLTPGSGPARHEPGAPPVPVVPASPSATPSDPTRTPSTPVPSATTTDGSLPPEPSSGAVTPSSSAKETTEATEATEKAEGAEGATGATPSATSEAPVVDSLTPEESSQESSP